MNSFNKSPLNDPYGLKNFISSYTLPESSEMLSQVFDHVTEGIHFAIENSSNKERMLDFLEAFEELLPALYRGSDENSNIDRIRYN